MNMSLFISYYRTSVVILEYLKADYFLVNLQHLPCLYFRDYVLATNLDIFHIKVLEMLAFIMLFIKSRS